MLGIKRWQAGSGRFGRMCGYTTLGFFYIFAGGGVVASVADILTVSWSSVNNAGTWHRSATGLGRCVVSGFIIFREMSC